MWLFRSTVSLNETKMLRINHAVAKVLIVEVKAVFQLTPSRERKRVLGIDEQTV